MSVQYILNKNVRIGDLKKLGFTIEDHRNKVYSHPFVVIDKQNNEVAISKVTTNDDSNEDNWEIDKFEGRFSYGGAEVMLDICDKLDCKFITDEDIDTLFRQEESVITDEMFTSRTDEFRNYVNNNG